MRQHIKTTPHRHVPGQLKVLQTGSDPRLWPGQILPLQNQTTIGADPANDLVLNDAFVSSHHAQLRWNGVGWLVEDLGSTNGTLIDGSRCSPHEECSITSGATLHIGDVELQLL